jgi:hypothetical protein
MAEGSPRCFDPSAPGRNTSSRLQGERGHRFGLKAHPRRKSLRLDARTPIVSSGAAMMGIAFCFCVRRSLAVFGVACPANAQYFDANGVNHGFLATPASTVPTPATLPLFATGLGLTALLTRKQRQHQSHGGVSMRFVIVILALLERLQSPHTF